MVGRGDVLHEPDAVLLDLARLDHARSLHIAGERLVVLRLGVVPVAPLDLQPDPMRRPLDRLGKAPAIWRSRVEEVDAGATVIAGGRGQRCALDGVVRYHARV